MEIIKSGQVIGVKQDRLKEYLYLHANIPKDVHDCLTEAGFTKLEIYVRQLPNGEYYLFQYNERRADGSDEPLQRECYARWMDVTGECQLPLPGEELWAAMDPAFTL